MFFSRTVAIGLVAALSATVVSASPACPSCDGLTYISSSGSSFVIECGLDRAGGDLSMGYTNTFSGCLDLCGSTAGCVDVSYLGTACYMKKTANGGVKNNVWGARMSNVSVPTTAVVAPVVSTSVTVSSATAPVSLTSSAVYATSTVAALTCSASNGQYYNTTSGSTFIVECGLDHAGGDMSMVYTASLASCIAACSTNTGCQAVSWVPGTPGPCYMKSSVQAANVNSGVWGAKIVSVGASSSSSSSASSASSLASSSLASSSSSLSSSSASPSSSSVFTSASVSSSAVQTSSKTNSTTSFTTVIAVATPLPSSNSTQISATSTTSPASSLTASSFSAASTAVSGCGLALPAGQTPGGSSQTVSITTADGLVRSYLINIPANYNASALTPLVFSFHGAGSTSANQEAITGFSTSAINPNMIAVYPQGVNNYWQGAPYSTAGVSDVAFTSQLLASLESIYCIDPNRVFASGMSNGGGFTGTLACDPVLSTRIAAFAAHSGAFYPGGTDVGCVPTAVSVTCNPGRAHVPFLEIHGNNDGQISYTGGSHNGQCMPAIPTYIAEWAGLDGYASDAITPLGNGNMMYQWGASASGQQGVLTHIMVNGLGHSWASAFNGFSSSPTMMTYFGQWTLNQAL